MRRLRRTSSASRPRCSPVSFSGRLSRSQRLRLSTGARPSAASFRASGMGPRQTRAGTLVRAAGVQAVSPAQRGRSGATRLDGGEHTGTLWVDEDYQPSVLPTDSAEDPAREGSSGDRA